MPDADIAWLSLESPPPLMARPEAVRKKVFRHMEKVDGHWVNVLEGLELHAGVFGAAEQKQIVECVRQFQEKGRKGMLRDRTYSEPRKWMRGKGRVTIQFGCCYNYAVDKQGNPPGILRDEEVDPLPSVLKKMIERMVEWCILPPTCIPNSCIVNIYDKDDCIPPHIDHHHFLRPFCTVSFLSECRILFGTELRVLGPGEFKGSAAISLPIGSVLILNGNGADVAKHCVPAVPAKRISITFRKMDDRKLPFKITPDPDLLNLRPLPHPPEAATSVQKYENGDPPEVASVEKHQNAGPPEGVAKQQNENGGPNKVVSAQQRQDGGRPEGVAKQQNTKQGSSGPFRWSDDEFPPLASSAARRRNC